MTNLKIGIIGTGKVTQGNYLPCLATEPDVSIGYFNRTQSKAEACAARFGGQVFPSLAGLMDWQPDSVLVLTGETDRYEAGTSVLNYHPQRLFFEKPLTAHAGQENVSESDFFDGQKMLQKAFAQGCETAMVFNYRFFDQTLAARQIVIERAFGQVRNITGLVHYACWSHAIDLVHHFSGPIARITALQGNQSYQANGVGISARDVTVAFCTDGDASGTLIGTAALAWKYPLFDLTFNFEHGRIRLQDLDGEMTVLDNQRMAVETYRVTGGDRSRWDHYNSSFKKSIAAYLQSIRASQPPPVPGFFGLLELQVEAAIKRSIEQSRPIKLAEEFPLNL
jgi:predicted dehydrogenase